MDRTQGVKMRRPHSRLVEAVDRLIDRRVMGPLMHLPVVSIGDIVTTPTSALVVGRRYALTYVTGKRVVGTVTDRTEVAGRVHYKVLRLDGAGWFSANTGNLVQALTLDEEDDHQPTEALEATRHQAMRRLDASAELRNRRTKTSASIALDPDPWTTY